jgi:ribonuclease HI
MRRRPNRDGGLRFRIYGDAASFNNGRKDPSKPCFAAWACITTMNGDVIGEMVDSTEGITNNEGELRAVLLGMEDLLNAWDLSNVPKPIRVTVVSDSAYVIKSINNYLRTWQKNAWVNSTGNPVPNRDLWVRILACMEHPDFMMDFKWVKAHTDSFETDSVLNDRCDALAKDRLFNTHVKGTQWDGSESYRKEDANLQDHLRRKSKKEQLKFNNDPSGHRRCKGTGRLKGPTS